MRRCVQPTFSRPASGRNSGRKSSSCVDVPQVQGLPPNLTNVPEISNDDSFIDLNRANINADEVFDITYEDHQMTFSNLPMQVGCGEHVVFNAVSNDLTYGFGIFRADHTLVAQMQVVPQSRNDLMWRFEKNGTYYVRSTEYSGPKGAQMVAQDAIVVAGCDQDDVRAVAIGGNHEFREYIS